MENPSVCVRHPHVETRLSCGQCAAPLCTKCAVFCEVGIKCEKCLSGLKSHALKASPRDLAMAGGLSVLAGLAWCTLFFMGLGRIPMIFAWILSYVAGAWTGGLVHRFSRYKLSRTVYAAALGGCVMGILLGVLQGAGIFYVLHFPINALSLLIFVIGFQGAFRPGK